MTKYYIGALVVVMAVMGSYFYFSGQPAQVQVSSTSGSTFSSARFAGIVADLSSTGTTGTTTSILNSDTGTRYVTGVRLGCDGLGTSLTAYTGAGLANLTYSVGTSSTANANTIGATQKVLNAGVVSTSSPSFSISTSTSGIGTNVAGAIWHTGEYMNFQFNATNTAACTVGVDYLGS